MSPKRIQRESTLGWRLPDRAVFVGKPSRWANPFDVGEHGLELSLGLCRAAVTGCWFPGLLRHLGDQACARNHEAMLSMRARLRGHPLEVARMELAGQDLVCWCGLDIPCHGDVLLDLVADAGR